MTTIWGLGQAIYARFWLRISNVYVLKFKELCDSDYIWFFYFQKSDRNLWFCLYNLEITMRVSSVVKFCKSDWTYQFQAALKVLTPLSLNIVTFLFLKETWISVDNPCKFSPGFDPNFNTRGRFLIPNVTLSDSRQKLLQKLSKFKQIN